MPHLVLQQAHTFVPIASLIMATPPEVRKADARPDREVLDTVRELQRKAKTAAEFKWIQSGSGLAPLEALISFGVSRRMMHSFSPVFVSSEDHEVTPTYMDVLLPPPSHQQQQEQQQEQRPSCDTLTFLQQVHLKMRRQHFFSSSKPYSSVRRRAPPLRCNLPLHAGDAPKEEKMQFPKNMVPFATERLPDFFTRLGKAAPRLEYLTLKIHDSARNRCSLATELCNFRVALKEKVFGSLRELVLEEVKGVELRDILAFPPTLTKLVFGYRTRVLADDSNSTLGAHPALAPADDVFRAVVEACPYLVEFSHESISGTTAGGTTAPLQRLKALKVLKVESYDFGGKCRELVLPLSLERVSFECSGLCGRLTADPFAELLYLRRLNLSCCSFQGLAGDSFFDQLPLLLTHIDLSYADLSSSIRFDRFFAGVETLKHLVELDLTGIDFKKPRKSEPPINFAAVWASLPRRLETFDISSCSNVSGTISTFAGLPPLLKEFSLGCNGDDLLLLNPSTLFSELGESCPRLEKFHPERARFCCNLPDGSAWNLAALPKTLKDLDIEVNRIKKGKARMTSAAAVSQQQQEQQQGTNTSPVIDLAQLSDFVNLTSISISESKQLHVRFPDVASGESLPPNLESLYIYKCKLTNLRTLGQLQGLSLDDLDLDGSELVGPAPTTTSLSIFLASNNTHINENLPRLNFIDLSECNFTDKYALTDADFAALPKTLRKLYVEKQKGGRGLDLAASSSSIEKGELNKFLPLMNFFRYETTEPRLSGGEGRNKSKEAKKRKNKRQQQRKEEEEEEEDDVARVQWECDYHDGNKTRGVPQRNDSDGEDENDDDDDVDDDPDDDSSEASWQTEDSDEGEEDEEDSVGSSTQNSDESDNDDDDDEEEEEEDNQDSGSDGSRGFTFETEDDDNESDSDDVTSETE